MRLYGVTGWKNAGKTGLMERLVSEISARGLTVSTVKHAHHDTDIDQPGRDSHRHREAGAREVMLATPHRWALMHELRGEGSRPSRPVTEPPRSLLEPFRRRGPRPSAAADRVRRSARGRRMQRPAPAL